MAGPHRWIAQGAAPWQASSFDTGLLPASGETVIFDGTGQGHVIGGMNQTAVDLALLHIMREYVGNIGQLGDPLVISADTVVHRGLATLHYKDGSGATDFMIIDSPNHVRAAFLGGTISRLRCLNGRTTLLADIASMSSLEIAKAKDAVYAGQVHVDDGSAGNFLTALYIDDGFFKGPMSLVPTGAPPTSHATIRGGRWRITNSSSAQGVRSIVMTGGIIEVATAPGSPGSVRQWTVTQFDVMGGHLDLSQANVIQFVNPIRVWDDGVVTAPADTALVNYTLERMES